MPSFCTIALYSFPGRYSSSLNEPDDDDPEHWDLGVYLTGIDLFQVASNTLDALFSCNA